MWSALAGVTIALATTVAHAAEPTSSPAPPAATHGPSPAAVVTAPRLQPPATAQRTDTPEFYGRTRPAVGASVMALGLGAGVTAGVMTHLALTPRCGDRSDMTTCEVPDGADIRKRIGLLAAGPVLAIGGGIMGGLGARSMMRNLDRDVPSARLQRRRKAATAVGAVAIVTGAAAVIVGPALAAAGAQRVVAKPDLDLTAPGAASMVMDDVQARLKGLSLTRSGLALTLVAPTLIATGVALLRHRPARNQTVRIAPQLGPRFAGASVSGRF